MIRRIDVDELSEGPCPECRWFGGFLRCLTAAVGDSEATRAAGGCHGPASGAAP